MIDGIPAPGPSTFTKRTLLDPYISINQTASGELLQVVMAYKRIGERRVKGKMQHVKIHLPLLEQNRYIHIYIYNYMYLYVCVCLYCIGDMCSSVALSRRGMPNWSSLANTLPESSVLSRTARFFQYRSVLRTDYEGQAIWRQAKRWDNHWMSPRWCGCHHHSCPDGHFHSCHPSSLRILCHTPEGWVNMGPKKGATEVHRHQKNAGVILILIISILSGSMWQLLRKLLPAAASRMWLASERCRKKLSKPEHSGSPLKLGCLINKNGDWVWLSVVLMWF